MICVRNCSNGGAAGHEHHSGLARRQTKDGVVALTGGKLRECTGGTCHRGALARTKLDVVHERTYRDLRERETVAELRSDS